MLVVGIVVCGICTHVRVLRVSLQSLLVGRDVSKRRRTTTTKQRRQQAAHDISKSWVCSAVPARHVPSVICLTCMFCRFRLFQLVVERDVSFFQLVVERDLRTQVRCNARVRDVRKTRNACSTPGPVRRDFSPGGKVRTAGLSHPVVKETHA